MSKRTLAIIAGLLVALFYAGNFTIAKMATPTHIGAYGLTLLRVAATAVILWIISLFVSSDTPMLRKDIWRVAVAAFCGVGFNMLTFMKGLSLTSPISASVLMITTPMIVISLSVLFFKEKLHLRRVLGILIGFGGATMLIITATGSTSDATNPLVGNLLVFVNSISYAFYIILAKKLTEKYDVITLLKWLYVFGILYVLPFGLQEAMDFNYLETDSSILLAIGYVIVFATVGTYLLNMYAISNLKPSVVAVFVYLQPLLASIIAISAGSDTINWEKLVSGSLIFIGVFLATRKVKTNPLQ